MPAQPVPLPGRPPVLARAQRLAQVSPAWLAIIGTGVLGGFTTFSTVAVETVLLAQRRRRDWAWVNLLGTFLVCLVAAAVGLMIGGLFPR